MPHIVPSLSAVRAGGYAVGYIAAWRRPGRSPAYEFPLPEWALRTASDDAVYPLLLEVGGESVRRPAPPLPSP